MLIRKYNDKKRGQVLQDMEHECPDRCNGECEDNCRIKNIAFLQYGYGEGSSAREQSDISESVSICVQKEDEDNPRASLIKSVNKEVTEPGDILIYTIHVNNTGDTSLSDVMLKDTLDSDCEYIDGSATIVLASTGEDVNTEDPDYDSNTNILTIEAIDELPEGDTFIYSYSVRVNDPIEDDDTIDNHVIVGTNETADLEDTTTVPVRYARVNIEKEILEPEDAECVRCGDNLTYVIRVEHVEGTAVATDLVITDLFDSEFCFDEGDVEVLIDNDRYEVRVEEGLLTVEIYELAPRESVRITVRGRICCCRESRR